MVINYHDFTSFRQGQGSVVTYGEHRLIESNPTSPPTSTDEDAANVDNGHANDVSTSANMLFGSSASQSTLSVSAKMKSASSGLDVIAEEDNDDENGAQVVPSIVAGGSGNAEVEDESEVMSQVFIPPPSEARGVEVAKKGVGRA